MTKPGFKNEHTYTQLTEKINSQLRRPPPRTEEKPVASVRPVQSTPVPMMPRQVSAGSAPGNDSPGSKLGGFPVNCLQKAGVFVQKIVTTTGRQTVHALQFVLLFKPPFYSYWPLIPLVQILLSS